MNFANVKRKVAKFNYELTIHELNNLPKSGNILYIVWKRGRKWTGETKKAFVKDKNAVWEESYTFKGTLFKSTHDRFKRKYVELDVHEVSKDPNSAKGRIGQLKINLADFASTNEDKKSFTKTATVKLWGKSEAELKYTITCQLRKRTNGTESELSEATTMTEVSSDEDENSNTSISNSLSPTIETGHTSDHDEESPTNVRRGRRQVMLPTRRRMVQMSLGGEQDSNFLDLIQNVDRASEEQMRKASPVEKIERIRSPQESEILKKEQEMAFLQQQVIKMERENTERQVIDILISTMQPNYNKNYPVSAPILYRILQHFDAFKPEKDQLLEKIIRAIDNVVNNNTTVIPLMYYWLSNTTVLLNIIQREFPATIDPTAVTTEPLHVKVPEDPLGNDPKIEHVETATNVDVFGFGNPLSKFCNELTLLSTTIYKILVKNAYDRLVTVLIQSMYSILGKQGRMNVSHVIKILNEISTQLDESHQFPHIKKALLSQLFEFISAHTLNAMLSPNSKYCTMGTSIMLKMAVSEIEEWGQGKGLSGNELAPIRQISDAMMMNKPMLADDGIRAEVCPALTVRQVRKMLQCFKPDEYDPLTVPPNVIKQFPAGNSETDHLVDTAVVKRPNFKADGEMPMWKAVQVPRILLDNKAFAFLNETK